MDSTGLDIEKTEIKFQEPANFDAIFQPLAPLFVRNKKAHIYSPS
jgi:hypothetical protein